MWDINTCSVTVERLPFEFYLNYVGYKLFDEGIDIPEVDGFI